MRLTHNLASVIGLIALGSACETASSVQCGDGIRDDSEACDDGNRITETCAYNESCAVCTAECQVESGITSTCGDGVLDDREDCDNASSSRLCPYSPSASTCMICNENCEMALGVAVYCGDGLVEPGQEECDDGNAMDGDGCDSNCTFTQCGNGLVTIGEVCDDGNKTDLDGCNADCRPGECGDGALDEGEDCDDANNQREACTYGLEACTVCDASCKESPGLTSFCGDGLRDLIHGEECDDGNTRDGDGCDSNCTPSRCGNGVRAGDEECDDGDAAKRFCAYGSLEACTICSSDCEIVTQEPRYCGNKIVDAPEEACDDADNIDGNGCNNDCSLTGCGDGLVTRDAPFEEECDDRNNATEACAYGAMDCLVCDADCKIVSGTVRYCGDGQVDRTEDGPQYTKNQEYQWEIRVLGNDIQVLIDGQSVYAVTDQTYTKGTIGLYHWGNQGYASDIRVTTLDGMLLYPTPEDLDPSVSLLSRWTQVDHPGVEGSWSVDVTKERISQDANSSAGSRLRTGGTALVFNGGYDWTDYIVRFRMASTDDDGIGVLFRYTDPESFYRAIWFQQSRPELTDRYRRLTKVVGGFEEPLGEECDEGAQNGTADSRCSSDCRLVAVSCGDGHIDGAENELLYLPGRTYQLEITANGPDISVQIDGREVLRARDGDHTRGTVGFFSSASANLRIANFQVERVSDGAIVLEEDFRPNNEDWLVYDDPGAIIGQPSDWNVELGALVLRRSPSGGTEAGPHLLGTSYLYRRGQSFENVRIRASILPDDLRALGITFRYRNDRNFYRWVWSNAPHLEPAGPHHFLMKVVDGERQPLGEFCDDGEGNEMGEGSCVADCSTRQECGDGIVNGSELCDDPVVCPDCLGATAPALWLDASDASTLTSDSPGQNSVVGWKDKSLGGNDLVIASATAPLLRKLGSGRASVSFDGTQRLEVETSAFTSTVTHDFSLFVALTPSSTTAGTIFGRAADLLGDPRTAYDFGLAIEDDGRWRAASSEDGSGVEARISAGKAVTGQPTVMSIVQNAAGLALYEDGLIVGDANHTISLGNSHALALGAALGSPGFRGAIAEVLLYPRALSETARRGVETYLQRKWATPAEIPGLATWVHPGAGLETTDGRVWRWSDQSGHANHFIQMDPNKRPQLVDQALQGRTAVKFAAAPQESLLMSNGFDPNFSIFYVARLAPGVHRRILGARGNNWLLGWWNGLEEAAFLEGWVKRDGVPATTDWQLYSAVGNGILTKIYKNGDIIAESEAGTRGPAGLALNGSFNEYSDCEVVEVIAYDRTLTEDERARVDAYLLRKYGL